jgi:hypothetical protein
MLNNKYAEAANDKFSASSSYFGNGVIIRQDNLREISAGFMLGFSKFRYFGLSSSVVPKSP